MKRGLPVALLVLAIGLAGCAASTDDDKKDEKHELRNSDAVTLPPPAQPTFGRELPAEPPPKPAGAKSQALAAAGADSPTKPELPALEVDTVPTLNLLFERYGTACYGLDWRFLKYVAQAESGLDPKNHTGKYVGLFQLEPETDAGHTCGMFIEPFKAYLDCSHLEDPEVNTAVAAHRFDRLFKGRRNWKKDEDYKGILEVCPDASVEEAVALAYVGHNNGPGVLKHILRQAKQKGWCKMGKQEEAVRSFYKTAGNDQGYYETPGEGKEPELCPKSEELKGQWSYHCVSEDYGARKWKYGVAKIVQPLREAGVERLYTTEDASKCPALQVPPRRLMPKPS